MKTTTRRALANRAEIFSLQLRRLATDTEAAALHPTDPRALGILDADRAEAIGAGERLLSPGFLDVRGEEHHARLLAQLAELREYHPALPASEAALCDALRTWATRWDAYAVEIDP